MRFDQLLDEAIQRELIADAEQAEDLLIEAMRLQRFDKLEHLVTVTRPGCPTTVASMIELAEMEES
jgi:hypothetical protein